MRHLVPLIAALLLVSCGGGRKPKPAADTVRSRVFLPAIPPASLAAEERPEWLRRHYWDRFDFSDTLFLAQVDTAQMVELLSNISSEIISFCCVLSTSG